MATIKSYTDLNQSRKLAEILPIESADMCYLSKDGRGIEFFEEPVVSDGTREDDDIPCWSLAALIDHIPQIKLDSISQSNRKHWRCCSYFSSDWHSSEWYDNPVDACYEMIIKLNEQKIL